MKQFRFLLFSLLLLLSILSLVNSAPGSVCCYNPNSVSIENLQGDICPSGKTFVGQTDISGRCDFFDSTQFGCIDESGVCSQTANGNYLFNIPALNNINQIYRTTYCPGGLVDFATDSRCSQSGNSGINIGNSGSGTGGNTGTSVTNPSNSGNNVLPSSKNKIVSGCSNLAGGSFGFFVTKDSCEASIDISKNSCLYNPYLGGIISGYSGFNHLKTWNTNSLEDSCISKSLIKTCFDYKTVENCNGNLAQIKDSCLWVPTSSFIPKLSLNKKSGICISNSTNPNKYYNKGSLGKSGNLIKNPSFENSLDWTGLKNSNMVISQNSFEGSRNYKLDNSGISQNIYGVEIGKQFIPSFYLMYKKDLISSGVKLEIIPHTTTSTLTSYVKTILISSLVNKNEGIFEKVNLNDNFIIPDGTIYLEIKLNSIDTNLINIDALSFIEQNILSSITNEQIFNPLQIIPSSASNCNLCFEDLNFNTCTKEKSDLLGDCSYLVSGPEDAYDTSNFNDGDLYIGNSNNKFMFKSSQTVPDKKLKWSSQSIANSKVFCELYVDSNQCGDPNNYINSKFKSFHPNSANSLCKWNPRVGCFKDSNNDGLTDTFTDLTGTNFPYISRFNDLLIGNYENNPIIPNTFDKNSFEKGCDVMPPNNYIYFTGKNLNGTEVVVTNSYDQIIGNLVMNLNINDVNLESCSDFNLSKSVILDVGINSNYFAKEFSSSQISKSFDLVSLFDGVSSYVDKLGTEKIVSDIKSQFFNSNGDNNFSFIVFDQSGNIGKEFKFNFNNLDLNPPVINLKNYDYFLGDWIDPPSSLGKGIIFNFSISDLTEFSCNFNLNPHLDYIDPSYYIASGNFDSSNMTGDIFSFNLSKYILKTTGNSDIYDLKINCTDKFGQSSIKNSIFSVDFDTSITLIKPDRYLGGSYSPSGYINNVTDFIAASSEISLISCALDFNNLNKNDSLNIEPYPLGFNLDNHPGVLFLNNITGILDFKSEGIQNGLVKCTDSLGNIFSKNLSYLYDKTKPILENFSLININYPDNSNSVYFDGLNYYVIGNLNQIKLDLTFNGTGSMVDNIQNLSGWNQTEIWNHLRNIPFNLEVNSVLESGISNLIISNFDNIFTYQGIEQSEKNLYLKKFSFNFKDRAKNSNSTFINYYFDNSKPKFIFSGDVISQDNILGEVYTSSSNPLINLSFDTPSYRKYTCRIIGKDKDGFSEYSFTNLNSNIIFNLSDIFGYLINVQTDNISLDISCTDIFNKKLSGKYNLIFDNKVPILNDINFNMGENKIFKTNSLNKVFPDIIDKLVFDLEDTGEISYACYYNLTTIDDSFYFCNQSNSLSNFYNSGIQSTKDLVFLEGTNKNNQTICFRSSKFSNSLKINSLDINESLNTKITMSGYCEDKVGLKTKVIKKDLNIIYTPNDFVSFDFTYKDKKAYAVIRSFVNYDFIEISSDRLSKSNIYETLSNPTLLKGNEKEVYEYKSITGFSLDNFRDGVTILYGVAPNAVSYITSNLIVDKVSPKVDIKIPDESNNEVFTNNFWVDLTAEDFGGSLNKVELFLDSELIFSYGNKENFTDDKRINLDLGKGLSFTRSSSYFSNSVELKNMTLNSNHTLLFKAYDQVNNMNQISRFIMVKDGVGLTLTNSITAKVDPSKRLWITSNKAPIIEFNTSKLVKSCSIDAMNNKAWKQKGVIIPAAKILSNGGNLINSFSLDLSTLSGFDLSQLNSKINLINISCTDTNDIHYNYIRELRYIDYLPDYVLTSTQGFVLNEEPYTTVINVKSVGPYRYLNCKYDDGKNGFIDFLQKNNVNFYTNLDYSDAIFNGVYNLKLQCSDILGNMGPIKTYPISINKNSPLQIFDLWISNSLGYKSTPVVSGSKEIIYVNDKNNLNLEFNLNKKNNVECDYNINSGGFFGFVSVIKNLFSIGTEKLTASENPFVYSFDKFSLTSNSDILNIRCSIIGTNQEVRKTYDVKFLENVNKVSNFN